MKLFWHIIVAFALMVWLGYQIGKGRCTDGAPTQSKEERHGG